MRERWWGYAHLLIFYAFLVFLLEPAELVISSINQGFSWNVLGAWAASAIAAVQGFFAVSALIGTAVFAGRRIVRWQSIHSGLDAWLILGLISLIMMTHFGISAAKMDAGSFEPWAEKLLIISRILAQNCEEPPMIGTVCSWINIICVSLFLVWIPRGKHLHIIGAFPAIFGQYRRYEAGRPVIGPESADIASYETKLEAALENPDVSEDDMPVIGLRCVSDLTFRMRLEAFACTQCQRCTNVCPMISAGTDGACGTHQQMISLRRLLMQKHASAQVMPAVIGKTELWACTQCGACERACAVGIEHITRMTDMRRSAVCLEQMPSSVHRVFALMERCGNPFGQPRSARMMPTVSSAPPSKALPSEIQRYARVLIFSGCMAAYDPAQRRTLQHTADWLVSQGFAVSMLDREHCCGDVLRRLGNESAFQACMMDNLKEIASLEYDIILTNCPHCAHILRHDYCCEASGYTRLHVMHIWDFLAHLHDVHVLKVCRENIAENSPENDVQKRMHRLAVLHVPCLLGKRPESSASMLRLSREIGAVFPDADAARAHCCGGGGGQFFLDPPRNMPKQRAEELLSAKPDEILTACPFCTQMIAGEMDNIPVNSLIDRMLDGVCLIDKSGQS